MGNGCGSWNYCGVGYLGSLRRSEEMSLRTLLGVNKHHNEGEMMMAKAKVLGYWLLEVDEACEVNRYGKGDKTTPFESLEEATECYNGFPYDSAAVFCVLGIFSDGRLKVYQLDRSFSGKASVSEVE